MAPGGPFIPPVAAVPQRPIAAVDVERVPISAVGSLLVGMLLLVAWVTNEALVSVGRGSSDKARLRLLGAGLGGLLVGFLIILTFS